MHNYKKIIAIPLAAVALFVSCSKTLTVDTAKKFIESKYSSATPKTFKGVSIIATAKPDSSDDAKTEANDNLSDIANDFGIAYTKDSFSLRGDAAGSNAFDGFKEICSSKITSNDIDEYEEQKQIKGVDAIVTYTSNASELSIYSSFKSRLPIGKVTSANQNELDIYDNNGQLRYVKVFAEAVHENHNLSITCIFEVTFAK